MPRFFITPWRGACYFLPITISGQTGGIAQMLHISYKVQNKKMILFSYIQYNWICTFSNTTTFLEPQTIFGRPTLKKEKHILPSGTQSSVFHEQSFQDFFFFNWEINLNFYACVWCNWWKEIACHEIYLVASAHALWPSGHLLQNWAWWSKGKQIHV